MKKMEVTLLVDAIRTRIRIPASYIKTHPHYKVMVNPDTDEVIIRLQRAEDADTRPAPQTGSYLISIHGAVKMLYRCPPAENQVLALPMKENGPSIDLTYSVSKLTMLGSTDRCYLVRDVIGRY